jgi:hypothetical protein
VPSSSHRLCPFPSSSIHFIFRNQVLETRIHPQ